MNLRRFSRRSQDLTRGPLSFAPLTEADLPLMSRWLGNPDIYCWVGGSPRPHTEICAKYLPRIRGDEPTQCYLIRLRETPIGHIQTYRIADYPEYEAAVGLGQELAGVDLFIGEDRARHRGLGATILRQFMAEYVFAEETFEGCVLSPEPENRVAIRAYLKAGFRPMRIIQTSTGKELLMCVGRREFDGEKARRRLRLAARIALAPYLGVLAYLTLRPSYPQAIEATYNALGRGYLHIPAYFGLGVLTFLALGRCLRKPGSQAGIAMAWCIAYGSLLEALQAFVPGRTPNALGILFDTIGATTAVVLLAVFRKRKGHVAACS